MPSDPISLEQATGPDLDLVERLLEANDLPAADVREPAPRFFLARVEGELVGVGGLEPCGAAGVLRSVAVADAHRGRGYGTALCDRLERRASDAGIDTLYLLTTTATGFFRQRGYEPVDRGDAPSGVRDTTQFVDLCPSAATAMRKHLG